MVFSKGWFCIRLHCSINVCLRKDHDRPALTGVFAVAMLSYVPSKFCSNEYVFNWFPSSVWYDRRRLVNAFQYWLIVYYIVDHLSQPIAMRQNSYIKGTTDVISFVEETIIPQDTILVSMDVTSLHTSIPQDDGIQTVCNAYENFHNNNPPIPSHYLKQMLGLTHKKNSIWVQRGKSRLTGRLGEQKWR